MMVRTGDHRSLPKLATSLRLHNVHHQKKMASRRLSSRMLKFPRRLRQRCLRQALKNYYDPLFGRNLDAENEILVTSGANEGKHYGQQDLK